MRPMRWSNSFANLLLVASVLVAFGQTAAIGAVLDDYISAPDTSYGWGVHDTIPGDGYTAFVLDLTSQSWRSPAEVDRTEWQHWLTVVEPSLVLHDQALLFIGGGSNNGPPDALDEELILLASLATATNSVVAYLPTVPNQPLSFTGDSLPSRTEDEIIAYSWAQYIDTHRAGSPDTNWPAQLPMTKSAVAVMDALQAFCASPAGGGLNITNFMLTGGSKRGWTTWLAAAADSRVSAIAPMVIDVLNTQQSMRHHYETYGFWAPAVQDYVDAGVLNPSLFNTPEMDDLMDIVDPYSYLDRYTMPKFLVNSTGDQFFLPDSSQFYYEDLPEEKYLRYVPNTDHSLGQEAVSVFNSIFLFYASQLDGSTLPEFSWEMNEDGSISIQTVDIPLQVNLWQASNTGARDFRYETIGPAWTSSTLDPESPGTYLAQLPVPEEGWTAFLVELYFDSGLGSPYIFTTEVMVLPRPLPGDVTGDGFVGADDLVTILTYWGLTGMVRQQGDLTGEGFVGADDYVEVLTYWGLPQESAPEPATLCLLALGVLILPSRRLNRPGVPPKAYR